MTRRIVRRVVPLAIGILVAGPLTGVAHGMQRADGELGEVDFATREVAEPPSYLPQPWEEEGIRLPLLENGAIDAAREDEEQLKFMTGGELGQFRPAPVGGSPFFGTGQPLFGVAAPRVLPSGSINPIGEGDGAGFLGERPSREEFDTAIPQLGETPDQRRESFAFLGEIPPIEENTSELPPVTPPPFVVSPTPGTTIPIPLPPPPFIPPTTIPPDPPTPTSPPTTAPTPTTTTTTTTPPTTTTTRPPTTTTTRPTPTTVPPSAPDPVVGTSFVLGNQVNSGTQCFSNDSGTQHEDCDQLFDIDRMKPGTVYAVDVTLWNAGDTDAIDLRAYAPEDCVPSTTGAGDLCEAIELTIQRYETSSRTTAAACIYGGGDGTTCTFSGARTIGAFARDHTSMTNGRRVVPGMFTVSQRAYLRVSVRLRDDGIGDDGFGSSNVYSGESADWVVRWEMVSA